MSPSNANISTGGGLSNGTSSEKNYIEHQVSKLDTLAGVAIKYGVEVADIKRLNGLATDLQMFALRTLLIPLPGRHPPSPILSTDFASSRDSDKTLPRPSHSSLLESFESSTMKSPEAKVSPAMSTLQNYYGLKSTKKGTAEGTEMVVYRKGSLDYLTEELLPKVLPSSGLPHYNHKPRNSTYGFMPENEETDYVPLSDIGDGEGEKSSEKSVRRRQKIEGDSKGTSERLLKEENGGGSSNFSPVTGKGLAMRPKSASRGTLSCDSESGWANSIPVGLGDFVLIDGVRKSSSTSSLQEQDNSGSSSVWPTSRWSLKPDLQALSAAASTIPMFDGLPKPMSGRKSKAAID